MSLQIKVMAVGGSHTYYALHYYKLVRVESGLNWMKEKPSLYNIDRAKLKEEIKRGVASSNYFYAGRLRSAGEYIGYDDLNTPFNPFVFEEAWRADEMRWNKPLMTEGGLVGRLIRTKKSHVFSRVVRLTGGTIVHYTEEGKPWGYPDSFTISNEMGYYKSKLEKLYKAGQYEEALELVNDVMDVAPSWGLTWVKRALEHDSRHVSTM